MSDGSPLVIRELEGERLELMLWGSDLPERGVPVGVAQRSVTTRYPGRAVTSTQMMGTEERDIVLNGVFNDVLFGSQGHAEAQVARGRRILQGMHMCTLEWGETLVRTGYLKEFEPEIERDSLIHYRIVFEVAAADEAEQIGPEIKHPKGNSALLAQVGKAQDAVDAVETVARGISEVGVLGLLTL